MNRTGGSQIGLRKRKGTKHASIVAKSYGEKEGKGRGRKSPNKIAHGGR